MRRKAAVSQLASRGSTHLPAVPQPKLSVAIIALNEEANLPGLLEQLDWVDEIVIVDGGSTDDTVQVARRYTDRVWVEPFRDFAEQRNRALAQCRGDWVLLIDADERPGPGLAEEVRRKMATSPREAAFRVPIESSIFGRRFRHSGTQDDRPIRLVARGRARWAGVVHEVARVDGRVGRLESGLRHKTLPTLRGFLAKMDRYTTLEAEHRQQTGKPARLLELGWRPPLEVFRRLVWKGGLLDGPAGWVFCLLSGVSTAVALVKGRVGAKENDGVARFFQRHEAWVDRLDRWVCQADVTKNHREKIREARSVENRSRCGGLGERSTTGKIRWGRKRRVTACSRKREHGTQALVHEVERAVAGRFDELAERFHGRIEDDDLRLRALFRYLGEVAGRRVLDLACGKGRYLRHLERAGARAVGVDLSRGMLADNEEASVLCARAGRLPFSTGSFDAVCCVEGFSHFPDPAGTLEEMARVLRPGGRLVLVDKNAASLDWRRPWLPGLAVKWLDEHRGRWMYPAGFVYREHWFWPPVLIRLLQGRFHRVALEYLISPLEQQSTGRWLFRRLPPVRHFWVIACVKR